MFDKFENRIIITADLISKTAIHIGATDTGFTPSMVKKPIIKDALGKPFIPGSSIKGVFRSFAESLFNSEMGLSYLKEKSLNEYVKTCNLNNICLDNEADRDNLKQLKEQGYLEEANEEYNKTKSKHENIAKYAINNSCLLCRVFGNGELASKTLFSDAKLKKDCAIEVRTGNAIDRDLNITLEKHIFDYEVIPSDTTFEFKLILENINKDELIIIKTLLNSAFSGMMRIGGNVSRGLGSFCLENIEVNKVCLENIFTEKNIYKLLKYDDFIGGDI